jgi:hypothetical protein
MNMPGRTALFAALLALAALSHPASGQTLYKYTGPDGRTVYSDKPPPAGIKAQKTTIDTSKRGVVPPSTREKAALKQMQADRKARESAQDDVRRAEIALHDAEVAAAMGKEPQPNERLGTAKGSQRLTDGYWERQKKLEANVEVARRNLEGIRAGR